MTDIVGYQLRGLRILNACYPCWSCSDSQILECFRFTTCSIEGLAKANQLSIAFRNLGLGAKFELCCGIRDLSRNLAVMPKSGADSGIYWKGTCRILRPGGRRQRQVWCFTFWAWKTTTDCIYVTKTNNMTEMNCLNSSKHGSWPTQSNRLLPSFVDLPISQFGFRQQNNVEKAILFEILNEKLCYSFRNERLDRSWERPFPRWRRVFHIPSSLFIQRVGDAFSQHFRLAASAILVLSYVC